jgi:alpha-1,2-mannosyltransferase
VQRIEQVASLRTVLQAAAPSVVRAALIALAILVAVAGLSAWRVVHCRMLVVILGAQLTVLMVAPSFFTFYSGYAAASASLVLAAATHRGFCGRFADPVRATAVVVAAAAAMSTLDQALSVRTSVEPFPGARLAASVRTVRCVMADSPMALIELDALSRGLAHGCPNWVDVTGRTYDVDRSTPPLGRAQNTRWQRDLRGYLLSGDALILIRAGTGASAATLDRISAHPVVARAGHYTVYSASRR